MSDLIESEPHVASQVGNILAETSVGDLMEKIKAKAFKKSFKVYGKSSQASVVKQSDFKEICANGSGDVFTQEFYDSIQDKVELTKKFADLYEVKRIEYLFT